VAYAHRGGLPRLRRHAPSGLAAPSPGRHPALLELHSLQALDATLAGASLREVPKGCSA
jgi:hypothetical protein